MRTVICRTEGCGRVGIVTTVHDTAVAPGIVTRPNLLCATCGNELSERDDTTAVEAAVAVPAEDRRRRQPRNATRRQPEVRTS